MKKIDGNVVITRENWREKENKLLGVENIRGDLSIYSQANLKSLKSVGGDLFIYSQANLKADNLKSVGGDLSIYSQANLKSLKSVGGYLSIDSQANLKSINPIIDRIVKEEKGRKYYINEVGFDKRLFNMVRNDNLSAESVFKLKNMEQRRVAYGIMDKAKMKSLKNYLVLDEIKDDGYGHPMKIISFKVKSHDKPFKFLNCFCPTGGREYFLETDKDKCWEAKFSSFGLDHKSYKFTKEY